MACVGPNGTTTKTVKAASTTIKRRHPEDDSVGLGGHDVFFEQQLDRVGDGLEQAVRAYAHGAETHLHVRQDFALEPVHRDDGYGKPTKDQQNVNRRPENARVYVSEAAGRNSDVLIEVGQNY